MRGTVPRAPEMARTDKVTEIHATVKVLDRGYIALMRLTTCVAILCLVVVAQASMGAMLIDVDGGKTKPSDGKNAQVTGTKKPSAPPPSSGKKASPTAKPAAPPAAPAPLPPPTDQAPMAADGLQRDSTAFSAIGASMRLPAGALVNRLAAEEFPAWEVLSGGSGPEWKLRVEQAWAPDPATDCAGQAKNALQSLGVGGAKVKVLSERSGKVSGCESRTVWASVTRGDAATIAGWLLVRTGDGIFVSVATATTPKDFAEAEATLDRSFATLQVVDPRAIQAERDAAIERGQALLKSLAPERVQALADGVSRVRRLWRAGADGSPEELGWVEMRMQRAPRSSAGRKGPSVLNNAAEREEGLLITLIARTLAADGTDRVETRANYWMSWDLQSEAWTVRSEQKGAGPKQRFEQVGLLPRTDGPPGSATLMVATDTGAGMSEPATWSRPPVAYLPQALTLVLSRMLPQDGSAPADMAFYALDPASGRLCQRLARWAKDGDASRWRLSVQNTPDTPPSVEFIDETGQLLRRQEADGSCMEPSTPAEIDRRWRALGLEP